MAEGDPEGKAVVITRVSFSLSILLLSGYCPRCEGHSRHTGKRKDSWVSWSRTILRVEQDHILINWILSNRLKRIVATSSVSSVVYMARQTFYKYTEVGSFFRIILY